MMPNELFTRGQLPGGIVMMVKKMPNGEEIATALPVGASDEQVLSCFRDLAAMPEPFVPADPERAKALADLLLAGGRDGR